MLADKSLIFPCCLTFKLFCLFPPVDDGHRSSSAACGDPMIIEIESYLKNPSHHIGPYEFLSWQESLSRVPKPSLFDGHTPDPFLAKSIPVFLVSCRFCGPLTLMAFDDLYYEKCVTTDRWWDTLFMRSFSQLLAHQWHNPKVNLVQCTELEKDIMHSSIDLSSDISKVVAFLYSSSHYVVVDYNISTKIFTVYDGLGYDLDLWIPHCTTIQARCGHPPVKPHLQLGPCERQPDLTSCGPLACLKLLHLVSDGKLGRTNRNDPGEWRSRIISYYKTMMDVNSGNILRRWRRNKNTYV